jgi:ATP-dependent RNA helicase RhlE
MTTQIPQHPVPTTDLRFDELGLEPEILEAVLAVGFVHPTPIQAAVVPTALEGRDLIGLAQTGSGKTAAFVIPIAQRLTHGNGLRAVILSPTREIALQTQAFIELFGRNHQLTTACLIGGVKFDPQKKALSDGPDIVVATPGRFLDHLQRRTLSVDAVTTLVLDEADHMLDLGFLPQVRKIVDALPRQRHTMMFSATMPPAIEELARKWLDDPVRIGVGEQGKAATGINHRLYIVRPEDKRECLVVLLGLELGSTLVFARRKTDTEWLYHILKRAGHPVSRIHSDRTQKGRVEALDSFREGEHRILVATDIAGRGIDIPGITHVINFDPPETVEEYIHRAGRTARASAEGIVSTIATYMDLMMIRQIEQELGEPLPRCSVPGIEAWVETPKTTRPARRLR